MKFKNFIIGICLGFGIWCLGFGVVGDVAEAQGKVFEPIYWFYGTVNPVQDTSLVWHYGDYSPIYVYYSGAIPDTACASDEVGVRGASGRATEYAVNMMWDYRNIPDNLTHYMVATVTSSDGYGAGPEDVTIDGTGVKRVDLTMTLGGGIAPPGPPPAGGTQRLSISRVADRVDADVKVAWTGISPDLYYMVGDGSGQFTNSPEVWSQVVSGVTPGFSFNFPERYMLHLGQVGAGNPEVYYKGLEPGVDKYTYLRAAEAVGKFNLNLEIGKDILVSTPFLPNNASDRSFGTILGNQLEGTGAVVYSYIDGYKPAYMQLGTWQGSLLSYGFDEKRGYWMVGTTVNKPITLVGRVSAAPSIDIPISGSADNMVGSPYPIQVTFDGSNLAGVVPGATDIVYGYIDGYKPAYREGGIWQGALVSNNLQPGRGYWILRKTAGDMTWNYPRIY
jgi:hypothetical protein